MLCSVNLVKQSYVQINKPIIKRLRWGIFNSSKQGLWVGDCYTVLELQTKQNCILMTVQNI